MTDEFMTVCVRKRPIISTTNTPDVIDAITTTENTISVCETKEKLSLEKYNEIKTYEFDYIYDSTVTTPEIYLTNIHDSVTNATNFVCYTFGETGSGKTHTLFGPDGLIQTTLSELIKIHQNVTISSYEIYNNDIYDLLNDLSIDQSKLMMCEQNKEINIMGLTLKECNNSNHSNILNMIKKRRSVGISSGNNQSSRSHCIVQIKTPTNVNYMFVDLAGSERAIKSICTNKKEYHEMGGINLDILALKECIRCIRKGDQRIPFRQTKLTMVLREAFFNNYKTMVIVTVSPESTNVSETNNILSYAIDFKNSKKKIKIIEKRIVPLSGAQEKRFMSPLDKTNRQKNRSVTPIKRAESSHGDNKSIVNKRPTPIRRTNSSPIGKSALVKNKFLPVIDKIITRNNTKVGCTDVQSTIQSTTQPANKPNNPDKSDKYKKLLSLIETELEICKKFADSVETNSTDSNLIDQFGYDMTEVLVNQVLIINKIDKDFRNKFILR